MHAWRVWGETVHTRHAKYRRACADYECDCLVCVDSENFIP